MSHIKASRLEVFKVYFREFAGPGLKKGDEMSREDTLDLSILSELLILQEDGESDIIDEMMSFYLIKAVERLKDIRNAMDLNDDQWLMKTAHKLKGSSPKWGPLEWPLFVPDWERVRQWKGVKIYCLS
jgi:hypothetical protein